MSQIKITASAIKQLAKISKSLSKSEKQKLLNKISKSRNIVTTQKLLALADEQKTVPGRAQPLRNQSDTINDFDENTIEMDYPLSKSDIVISDAAQLPSVLKELFQRDSRLASMSSTKLLEVFEILTNALAAGDRGMSAQYINDLLMGHVKQQSQKPVPSQTRKLQTEPAAQQQINERPQESLSPSDLKELQDLSLQNEEDVFAPLSTKVDMDAPTRIRNPETETKVVNHNVKNEDLPFSLN